MQVTVPPDLEGQPQATLREVEEELGLRVAIPISQEVAPSAVPPNPPPTLGHPLFPTLHFQQVWPLTQFSFL